MGGWGCRGPHARGVGGRHVSTRPFATVLSLLARAPSTCKSCHLEESSLVISDSARLESGVPGLSLWTSCNTIKVPWGPENNLIPCELIIVPESAGPPCASLTASRLPENRDPLAGQAHPGPTGPRAAPGLCVSFCHCPRGSGDSRTMLRFPKSPTVTSSFPDV